MQKALIYGIGNNYFDNRLWLEHNYEIIGISDGNEERWGQEVDGRSISCIDSYPEDSYDIVIVTPAKYREIIPEIIRHGVNQIKIQILGELLSSTDQGRILRTCFSITGGLGDDLVALNYIYTFLNYFGIGLFVTDLLLDRGAEAVKEVLGEKSIFRDISNVSENDIPRREYDLIIRIVRYPRILKKNNGKILRIVPDLVDYLLLCEKFEIYNPRFFSKDYESYLAGAFYEMNYGRKRIQQPDIFGYFEMEEDFMYPIETNTGLIKRWGLKEKQYVTIHYGCEKRNFNGFSTKTWGPQNYRELIKLLKERIPKYEIVLVGMDYEKTDDIDNYDKSLVGETSISELKAVLKCAYMHVDTEGGLVHLRHAVRGGRSVVLFGPTSNRFYGYSENRNCRLGTCPVTCEWVTKDWSHQCAREDGRPVCMESITPTRVMKDVEKILEEDDE